MKILTFPCLLGLVCFTSVLHAQKLSGRVLNEAGRGAALVSVQFKNSRTVCVTASDGSFSIPTRRLPDTLVFSAVGYESYQVAITEKTLLDPTFEVVLLTQRGKTEEVVVTAYGVSRDDYESMPYGTPLASTKTSPDRVKGLRTIPAGESYSSTLYSRSSGAFMSPGSYLSGKKIYNTDSIPLKGAGYKAGLLTAGEVNDFNKWKMWEDFQEGEFKLHSEHWGIFPKQRFSVQVQNLDHVAMVGQPVYLLNKMHDTVWAAVTDNTGKAELWAAMKGPEKDESYHISSPGCQDIKFPSVFANGINKMELNKVCSVPNKVDIAFVVDATGSMGDEIDYLKVELEDVIRNTFSAYNDLDLRVGSVFYRDRGDQYLTRHIDFQSDLLKLVNFIKLQNAGGGGDTPESVEVALGVALDSLQWSADARTRIMFLVLDAPPHDEAKDEMYRLMAKASAKGIRIVPVVCSGAEKTTEFLMRSLALATNGTYVFLTDNSGVGGSHIKPTTDAFNVELLNSLLERVIKQMVFTNKCAEVKTVEPFKTQPANIEKLKIYPNPTQGNVTLESTAPLKQIFVTDFTGKILQKIETNPKQTRWNINIGGYPNATYLVKYITSDDQWGAEKVVLIH